MEPTPIKAKQKESEHTYISAETDNKENYPLIERITVENTPFNIVGNKEVGYKLTWGRFNLTDKMKTEEEVRNWQLDNRWDITMKLIHIYVENYFIFKEKMTQEEFNTTMGEPDYTLNEQ